jgi:two-component system, NtrC family, nitrogen regulation response regulator GlnG
MTTTQIIESLHLVGKSDLMQQLYKMIGRICNADCAILLIGEKGSGKSMVARALHFFSHRAAAPFYVIRGAESTDVSDEELLGITDHYDANSTYYVKDFASMSFFAQDRLLSIQRKKEFRCSHTNQSRKHNFRFIAASTNIKQDIESGKMPVDMFYDWSFLSLYVPPLRDRKEDIPLLANYFLESLPAELRVSRKELSPEATEALLSYDWPGNLDELKEALGSALLNCRGNYIRADQLPSFKKPNVSAPESFQKLEMFLNSKLSSYIENAPASMNGDLFRLLLPQIEKSLFQHALRKSKGNQNKAAQMLGLHRNTLNKKLQKLIG